MANLSDVKGINARQIKLLQESGISTAEALAMSPGMIVADIDGLGDKTAKKLIWNARNALGMTEFVSAETIDENVEYITTGSSEFNKISGKLETLNPQGILHRGYSIVYKLPEKTIITSHRGIAAGSALEVQTATGVYYAEKTGQPPDSDKS